jgi:hypothetical protein
MWTMILCYLPQEAAKAQAQGFKAGIWVKEYAEHANWQEVIDALQVYIGKFISWDWNQRDNHWVKKVGLAQFKLPIHVFQEYCSLQGFFNKIHFEADYFLQRALPRWLGKRILEGDFDFGLVRCRRNWRPLGLNCIALALGECVNNDLVGPSWIFSETSDDRTALIKLYNQRIRQRSRLISQLLGDNNGELKEVPLDFPGSKVSPMNSLIFLNNSQSRSSDFLLPKSNQSKEPSITAKKPERVFEEVKLSTGYCVLMPKRLPGLGPKYYCEVSDWSKTVEYIRNLPIGKVFNFVFDPNENIVGMCTASQNSHSENKSKEKISIIGLGHDGIRKALCLSVNGAQKLCGGRIGRIRSKQISDRIIIGTSEWSGHYGTNWNDQLRLEFLRLMKFLGLEIFHLPWQDGQKEDTLGDESIKESQEDFINQQESKEPPIDIFVRYTLTSITEALYHTSPEEIRAYKEKYHHIYKYYNKQDNRLQLSTLETVAILKNRFVSKTEALDIQKLRIAIAKQSLTMRISFLESSEITKHLLDAYSSIGVIYKEISDNFYEDSPLINNLYGWYCLNASISSFKDALRVQLDTDKNILYPEISKAFLGLGHCYLMMKNIPVALAFFRFYININLDKDENEVENVKRFHHEILKNQTHYDKLSGYYLDKEIFDFLKDIYRRFISWKNEHTETIQFNLSENSKKYAEELEETYFGDIKIEEEYDDEYIVINIGW